METKSLELQPINAFLRAINRRSTEDFLKTLGERIVINDEGQTYRGLDAARKWCDEKCVAAGVTLKMIGQYGTVVSAEVDGTFDKAGLPDPLILDFHFTIGDGKIGELTIRLPGE